MLTATIPTEHNHDGKISANRKAKYFTKQYTLISPDFRELVVLRIYETNKVAYACLWVNDKKTNTYITGGGNAGGYGYHRPSAAFSNALCDAKISTSEDIDGRGGGAIEATIYAIGKALGHHNGQVFTAHA